METAEGLRADSTAADEDTTSCAGGAQRPMYPFFVVISPTVTVKDEK